MHAKLASYFSKIMPLSAEEASAIADTLVCKSFKKGTTLLSEGQKLSETYFVIDGCVRQYYLADGEERIRNFFTEGQWVISVSSAPEGADHFLDCCADTTLAVGDRTRERGLYQRFPRLQLVSIKIMEQFFAQQQQQMTTYFINTPEQRYIKLLESRPELVQRIPQYQIASYIGVQPESLSRIRKRFASR